MRESVCICVSKRVSSEAVGGDGRGGAVEDSERGAPRATPLSRRRRPSPSSLPSLSLSPAHAHARTRVLSATQAARARARARRARRRGPKRRWLAAWRPETARPRPPPPPSPLPRSPFGPPLSPSSGASGPPASSAVRTRGDDAIEERERKEEWRARSTGRGGESERVRARRGRARAREQGEGRAHERNKGAKVWIEGRERSALAPVSTDPLPPRCAFE